MPHSGPSSRKVLSQAALDIEATPGIDGETIKIRTSMMPATLNNAFPSPASLLRPRQVP